MLLNKIEIHCRLALNALTPLQSHFSSKCTKIPCTAPTTHSPHTIKQQISISKWFHRADTLPMGRSWLYESHTYIYIYIHCFANKHATKINALFDYAIFGAFRKQANAARSNNSEHWHSGMNEITTPEQQQCHSIQIMNPQLIHIHDRKCRQRNESISIKF